MLAGFEHFRELPIADKLRLVEEMWDDIAQSTAANLLTPEDRAEMERRIADMEANPHELLTREELWQRVDEIRG